jgi:hypothetical protein
MKATTLKRTLIPAVALIALSAAGTAGVQAQPRPQYQGYDQYRPYEPYRPHEPHRPGPWSGYGREFLGQREVDFRGDRDVIHLRPSEGSFRRVRIDVQGAPIQLRDLKLVFSNDSVFDPELQHHVVREGSSLVFDLPGNRRVIRSIAFVYRSVDRHEGKALVKVYGER